MDWLQWWNIKTLGKNLKNSAKNKKNIIPHYESHLDTQNQMRLENYPQYGTQCATQWDSQNHMKRANNGLSAVQGANFDSCSPPVPKTLWQ